MVLLVLEDRLALTEAAEAAGVRRTSGGAAVPDAQRRAARPGWTRTPRRDPRRERPSRLPVAWRQEGDGALATPHRRDEAAASDVDTSVIALWLGHEQAQTRQIYLHAELAIEERALARTALLNGKPGRYQAPDAILAFLEGLGLCRCQLADLRLRCGHGTRGPDNTEVRIKRKAMCTKEISALGRGRASMEGAWATSSRTDRVTP